MNHKGLIGTETFKSPYFSCDIEGIFVEINLRKPKWLSFGTYHFPGQDDKYFFDFLGKALDIYSNKYDNFLLAGDFNAKEEESNLDYFRKDYEAKNIMFQTCFKNIENPICSDLFISKVSKILKQYPLSYLIFRRCQ